MKKRRLSEREQKRREEAWADWVGRYRRHPSMYEFLGKTFKPYKESKGRMFGGQPTPSFNTGMSRRRRIICNACGFEEEKPFFENAENTNLHCPECERRIKI